MKRRDLLKNLVLASAIPIGGTLIAGASPGAMEYEAPESSPIVEVFPDDYLLFYDRQKLDPKMISLHFSRSNIKLIPCNMPKNMCMTMWQAATYKSWESNVGDDGDQKCLTE